MPDSDLTKIFKTLIALPLCLALGGMLYGLLGWGWIDTGMPVGVSVFIIIVTIACYVWVLNRIWRPKNG